MLMIVQVWVDLLSMILDLVMIQLQLRTKEEWRSWRIMVGCQYVHPLIGIHLNLVCFVTNLDIIILLIVRNWVLILILILITKQLINCPIIDAGVVSLIWDLAILY